MDFQQSILSSLEAELPVRLASNYERLVHFQDAYKTPVQRWYPYREGYSTELVLSFIKELGIKGTVLDPFAGSGTTLLAARRAGLHSVGIEVNPISVLVSECENDKYSKEDIVSLENLIQTIQALSRAKKLLTSSYSLASKMFNEDILSGMLQVKSIIEEEQNPKVRRLAFVSWLATIDDVSDVKKEGNGLKYRYRKRTPNGYVLMPKEEWERAHFPGDRFELVKSKIIEKLLVVKQDIQDYYGPIEKVPNIIHGDCLSLENLTDEKFELTFFSPPYCNCFDYFEIHKVELWLGGFVSNSNDIRNMKGTGFRSNTNALTSKQVGYKNPALESLINLFDRDRLWSSRLPQVVRGYFDDMHTLLKSLYRQTVEGGYVGIVIGNSAYSGVIIPSDLLSASIGQEVGFSVESILVARHLTTSSQQKKELEALKGYLRESIVLLKK